MSRNTSPQSFASDEEIIEMYWQRDPDAIQATDHKYGKLLQNTACNILSDLQDSEECQNNVHLRVWNAIPSTRPTDFFCLYYADHAANCLQLLYGGDIRTDQ